MGCVLSEPYYKETLLPRSNRKMTMVIIVIFREQKFHSFARNYQLNLERTSRGITGGSNITYHCCMFFIAYAFKGQVHVFAGPVKIVSHSSCRTSAILKYFCPLIFL